MKILILEDNPLRLYWFRKYFNGETVDCTDSPDEAITWLKESEYDRIYLDHDLLPEHYQQDTICNKTTGLAVAEFLAESKNNPQARIYIHSRNWSGVERIRTALESGNRDCMIYPFDKMSGLDI